jgi:hypothetical protein
MTRDHLPPVAHWLRTLGVSGYRPPRQDRCAALAWAASGGMELTGPADGPPCLSPAPAFGLTLAVCAVLSDFTAAGGTRVDADAGTILAGRSATGRTLSDCVVVDLSAMWAGPLCCGCSTPGPAICWRWTSARCPVSNATTPGAPSDACGAWTPGSVSASPPSVPTRPRSVLVRRHWA